MPDTLILTAWLAAGSALGAVYFHLIARSVAALRAPARKSAAAGWLLFRMALAACILVLAAMQGAGPLLAVLAGFLAARAVALRRARRA